MHKMLKLGSGMINKIPLRIIEIFGYTKSSRN